MTIILYINQILYLLFTTAYTGHRIWSNLIYLRALRAQTRINGLLVSFFDWRGIWRQNKQLVQRCCLIFARRQKSLKLTWTSGAEREREKEPLHAQLRIYAHTQVRRQFRRITPVIHVSVWGRCLSDTREGLTEFIIHLTTETSQYQLSAARHV